MVATIILNPYANRWKALEQAPEIEACFKNAGIPYELKVTDGPLHGTELAKEAVKSGNLPVIAAGGDGTISEVLNGLVSQSIESGNENRVLGIIPIGTANDLGDMLSLPTEIKKAVDLIAKGHKITMDVCTVNDHYFGNNSAIGLEPVVTIENIRLTWLKGVIRYLVSAVLGILKNPTWDSVIEWDDGKFEGEINLVSVGNSPRTGGVFFMTPEALLNDGKLDFIFAPKLNRRALFQLLPKTQTGEHINDPAIKMHRTSELVIRTKTPTPIQADGEIFDTSATEIRYGILPKFIEVFTPEGVEPFSLKQ